MENLCASPIELVESKTTMPSFNPSFVLREFHVDLCLRGRLHDEFQPGLKFAMKSAPKSEDESCSRP